MGDLHGHDRRPDPDADLVVVLETTEASLLPVVRAVLEQEGIEYAVRNSGISSLIIGDRATATVGNTAPPFQVVVLAENEARARDVLAGIEETSPAGVSVPPPAAAPVTSTSAAPLTGGVDLIDPESGASIGRLTSAQFESLAGHLERESSDDTDYYIDEPTLAMLEERGADAGAVALLRRALGTRPGMDVRWARLSP
jgi:hypothetical protein